MSGPKFVLRALGGLSMKRIDGNTPVLVDQRKRLGLLAVIAAAGSAGVTRDRLLAFLWPESDDAHARNALNQLVYAIRRDLGSDVSMEADGALSLCAETIESDIERFRAARARGAFLEAVELYAGPFLDGVYLRDVPDFERWVEESRRSFADGYSDALDRLVISALASGEMVRAAHWARALVAHDPLNTRYALRLIQVLDTNGERAAAIRHAELHGLLLKQELGWTCRSTWSTLYVGSETIGRGGRPFPTARS